MRTTLDIDDDVLEVAREIASIEGRSLGYTISKFARRGLPQATIDLSGDLPLIKFPDGSPPITPEMVRRAMDDDF